MSRRDGASWDFSPRAEWAAGALALTAAGVEWPEPIARQHLRHLQAGALVFGDRWPSLTELAATFGWRSSAGKPAVKRVRVLLLRWRDWSDPEKAEAWERWLAARNDEICRSNHRFDSFWENLKV